jgi:hypothetical protein
MAPFKQDTPEKQLLDLIEKPANHKSPHLAAARYHGLSFFSFKAMKGRFSFFKNKFKGLFKNDRIYQVDVKTLNQFLKFTVILLSLYFVLNLSVSLFGLKKDLDLKIDLENAKAEETAPAVSLLKTLTYYLEKARERDLFNMGVNLPLEVTTAARGPSPRIIEATKDFRLVGISWSDDPDVMIEDTANQRTLFLKKGQTFGNDVRLKGVFKDRVILGFAGEEIELR